MFSTEQLQLRHLKPVKANNVYLSAELALNDKNRFLNQNVKWLIKRFENLGTDLKISCELY